LTALQSHVFMQQRPTATHKMSTPKPEIPAAQQSEAEPLLRDLFSFSAGNRTFAVFEEDVEGTAESKRPARLPHAPPAVLGVVCVRGRMLTTLDPFALVEAEPASWPQELPLVIALRGDEQLALAADSLRETITIASTDIEQFEGDQSDRLQTIIAGVARHGGEELTILNASGLFAAAFQRTERRRRRF
jgi:chemotaxis signal transduction protein